MNSRIKIIVALLFCLSSTLVQAETDEAIAPAAPVVVKPVVVKPIAHAPVVAAPSASPAATLSPTRTPASSMLTPPPSAAPAASALSVPVASVITLEQRHQQEVLANAERIDKANRELLARNQELQLQNENMGIQINVLKRDRSADGIRNGALAVIAGFLMGWFFSGVGRRKSEW